MAKLSRARSATQNRRAMESSEDKLNAFALERAELIVTQQLLKIALNHIIMGTPDPRAARETIAAITDQLISGYEIKGFGTAKAEAAREFMKHHATTLLSEVGNQS